MRRKSERIQLIPSDSRDLQGAFSPLRFLRGYGTVRQFAALLGVAYGDAIMRVCTAVVLLASWALDGFAGQIYWTELLHQDQGLIRRANADGTGVETVLDGLAGPHGIAIDDLARKIYWTDVVEGTISRADLNGQNRETLVTNLAGPLDVALDPQRGYMYWVDQVLNLIASSTLDGHGITPESYGQWSPESVAVDTETRTLYWTDVDYPEPGGTVGRLSLFDHDATPLLEDVDNPWWIAFHGGQDRLYWSQFGDATIRSVDPNGLDQLTVFSSSNGAIRPGALAIDEAGGRLFFANDPTVADDTNDIYALALESGSVHPVIDARGVRDLAYTSATVPEASSLLLAASAVFTIFLSRATTLARHFVVEE